MNRTPLYHQALILYTKYFGNWIKFVPMSVFCEGHIDELIDYWANPVNINPYEYYNMPLSVSNLTSILFDRMNYFDSRCTG
jgi:3'-phosphoadenosine 5'-phosphosulfate sulfotransferase (PAPS reductase)/FAD synthetase